MKKIGLLFGMERTFPQALIERINSRNIDGISAEAVKIDKVPQAYPSGYDVILDRISHDVPFYRAYVKNAALTGTAVVNNPFWFSADEKFFNNCIAIKLGVPVPKTVLLPSYDHPDDTSADSFSNLASPLDWDGMLSYIGFPAYMKPHAGGGWKHVYKISNKDEIFEKQQGTGKLVMLLQEAIEFESYFRVYCVGRKDVRIMHYEPRNPHHLRYAAHHNVTDDILQKIHDYTLKLNDALGYELNTAEFAVREGIPYAIDFCNPVPDTERQSVGDENFEWIVEHMTNYLIERAQNHKEGADNLSWGSFMTNATSGKGMPRAAK